MSKQDRQSPLAPGLREAKLGFAGSVSCWVMKAPRRHSWGWGWGGGFLDTLEGAPLLSRVPSPCGCCRGDGTSRGFPREVGEATPEQRPGERTPTGPARRPVSRRCSPAMPSSLFTRLPSSFFLPVPRQLRTLPPHPPPRPAQGGQAGGSESGVGGSLGAPSGLPLGFLRAGLTLDHSPTPAPPPPPSCLQSLAE